MKNIGRIFKRDIKSIFTNSMAIILAVGIAVLPSLYAWFNIYANWDPYGSTGNMQVAVVIEDEGYRFHDVDINVGAEIESNLKANDLIDWQFVSKKEAISGVESSKYYAAIEIPKGFSKSLTSIVSDNFKQPQITYYANEKKNAIATKITDKVVQTIQQEVNESFVTTVINVVSSLIDVVAETTKSGALNTFSDLQGKIDGACDTIDSIQKSVDGFEEIMSLTDTLKDAVNDEDLQKLLDRTNKLLESGVDMTVLLKNSIDGITSSVDTTLSKATADLKDAEALVSGINAAARDKAAKPLADAEAKMLKLKAQLEAVRDTLETVKKFLPVQLRAVDKALEKLNKHLAKVDSALALIAKAKDGKASQERLDRISEEINAIAAGVVEIQNDYKSNIQPVVNENLTALIDVLSVTGDLVADLNGDMPALKTIAGSLDSTVQSGADLIATIDSLLNNTKKELKALSAKIGGLGDSEILNTIKNIAGTNSEQLGAFIACPVIVNTQKVYGIETYGSAMAPFYSTLAIWVGTMFLVAVVKTKIKNKKEISEKLKLHEGYFGRMLTYLLFSLVQSTVICLGDLYFLKIQCFEPAKFMLVGIAAAVAFTVFVYSLTYTFGDIGKSIAIIMLVVQIGGSGGTFPIDVVPEFFRAIHPYLPFTFVVNAMRECVCGTYSNDYWIDLLKLSAYIGIGLIIGIGVKFLVKKPIRFFEKRVEKTGLF